MKKRSKKTARARPPKQLSVAEVVAALKVEIVALRALVSAGGKSDIDTVGDRLDAFAAKLQAIIERNES